MPSRTPTLRPETALHGGDPAADLTRRETQRLATEAARRDAHRTRCDRRGEQSHRRRPAAGMHLAESGRVTAPLDPTLRFQAIVKRRDQFRVPPNLLDYRKERARFTWAAARQRLEGLPDGRGLNIAHEAVDRHANGPRRDRVAIRWRGRHGAVRELRYAELAAETSRFANALRALGVGKGDPVFALAGRIPELYVAALGALKNASVFCPLFAAFGPEPIRQRLARARP